MTLDDTARTAARVECGATALRDIPADYCSFTPRAMAAAQTGHRFFRGLHSGWVWGEDARGVYLDFLWEHRMAGMTAERIRCGGDVEPIEVPSTFCLRSDDPETDAELERAFFARNDARYSDLRRRGLLHPEGENLVSQDLTEYVQRGGG